MKHWFQAPLLFYTLLTSIPIIAEEVERHPFAKAEELFDATLYQQAIPYYQQALCMTDASQNGNAAAMPVRLKLAQAFFFQENFNETLALLREMKTVGVNDDEKIIEIKLNAQYLSGLALRHLGKYQQSVAELESYLSFSQGRHLTYDRQAQFELALSLFLSGDMAQSQSRLNALIQSQPEQPLFILANIYLAKISLAQGCYAEAEKLLSNLSATVPPDGLSRYEVAYLRGKTFFQLGDYFKAVDYFGKSIPALNREKMPWYSDALYHLGECYLKIGMDSKSPESQALYLQKAEDAFTNIVAVSADERSYLALGQCYLLQGRCLGHEGAYLRAEAILNKPEIFCSKGAQAQALLLRAEAAPSYLARDKLYRHLTQEAHRENPCYSMAWFLRGINDFDEGQALLAASNVEEAKKAFERSAYAFESSFELFKESDKRKAGLALKYQAEAHESKNTYEGLSKAFLILDTFIRQHQDILASMDHPDEIFYLHSLIAFLLAEEEEEQEGKYAQIAERSLKMGIDNFPNGKFVDKNLYLLGTILYQKGLFTQAENAFLKLTDGCCGPLPSPLIADAWFWAANCAEKLSKDAEICRQRRQNVFERYPESKYAPEAYFTYYSYKEYLQGNRTAIKHLQSLEEKFGDSIYVIHANYLIGQDCKRDRKTLEGKWLRKKNLTAAIDAFHKAEAHFDVLMEKGLIPKEKFEYTIAIRYRAVLERALANLAIADESQGAKHRIYMEYAEEVFHQLVDEFENPDHHLTKHIAFQESYPQVYEESSFWLGQMYTRSNNDEAAEKVFAKMLDRYQEAKITRGYFLSRVWYEQGMIAQRIKEYHLALECFKHGEDAAKGKLLTTDQKLDLWIQQSLCYKGLNQYDQSILLLSKALNDDAVSGLRLKAMLLRAEIYELQGRPELARKQLESTAKKGGEWSLKAKEKLEKEYGY